MRKLFIYISLIIIILISMSCTYDVAIKGNYSDKVIEVRQSKLYKFTYYTSPFIFGAAGYHQGLIKFSDDANQNQVAGAISGALVGILSSYITDKLIFRERKIEGYGKEFNKKWIKTYNRNNNTNWDENGKDDSHINYLSMEAISDYKLNYIRWYDYWLYENRDLLSLSYIKNNIDHDGVKNQINDNLINGQGGMSLNYQNEYSNIAFNMNAFFEPFDFINNIKQNEYVYYLGASFDISYVAQLTDFVDFYNGLGYQYAYFDNLKNEAQYPNLNSIYFKHSLFIRPFIDYYLFLNIKQSLLNLDDSKNNWNSFEIGVSYEY